MLFPLFAWSYEKLPDGFTIIQNYGDYKVYYKVKSNSDFSLEVTGISPEDYNGDVNIISQYLPAVLYETYYIRSILKARQQLKVCLLYTKNRE